MTQLENFRKNLLTLRDDFSAATSIAPTYISIIVAEDRAFYSRVARKDFRVGTYDTVVGRFSAIWPKTKPWPKAIARPAPVELGELGAALLAQKSAANAEETKEAACGEEN